MKISQQQLEQIIAEEVQAALEEFKRVAAPSTKKNPGEPCLRHKQCASNKCIRPKNQKGPGYICGEFEN